MKSNSLHKLTSTIQHIFCLIPKRGELPKEAKFQGIIGAPLIHFIQILKQHHMYLLKIRKSHFKGASSKYFNLGLLITFFIANM